MEMHPEMRADKQSRSESQQVPTQTALLSLTTAINRLLENSKVYRVHSQNNSKSPVIRELESY